jgi:hypothetical protein
VINLVALFARYRSTFDGVGHTADLTHFAVLALPADAHAEKTDANTNAGAMVVLATAAAHDHVADIAETGTFATVKVVGVADQRHLLEMRRKFKTKFLLKKLKR